MYVLPPARKPLPYSLDERNRRYVPLLIGLALTLLIGGLFAALVMPLSPRRMAQPSADLIPALPLWSFVAGLPLTVPRDGPALAAPLATQSEMKAENTLGALGLGGLREALVRLG